MSQIKFSIIVPIYKTEPYLKKCLDTLIGQTYRNIEIILVDDGSPDNSPRICDEYAKADSRIKVIHKENGGLSDARNKGLDQAEGEYILFADSDDYIEIDSCEKLLPFADKGCDILVGDVEIEGSRNYRQYTSDIGVVLSGTDYLLKVLRDQPAAMAAWLNVYRRDFLLANNLRFKFGILHEDEQFTPRAFLAAESVVCTGVKFYHYIIRDNSITTKKDGRKNARDFFDTCLELEGICEDLNNEALSCLLRESLCRKYLSQFQERKLYQYGKEYIHKDFVKRNAYTQKTKMKSRLFRLSPVLYWHVNNLEKRLKKLI